MFCFCALRKKINVLEWYEVIKCLKKFWMNYPVHVLPGAFKRSRGSFTDRSKAHANSQTLWNTKHTPGHAFTHQHQAAKKCTDDQERSPREEESPMKEAFSVPSFLHCTPFTVIRCALKTVCEMLVIQSIAHNLVGAEDVCYLPHRHSSVQ